MVKKIKLRATFYEKYPIEEKAISCRCCAVMYNRLQMIKIQNMLGF